MKKTILFLLIIITPFTFLKAQKINKDEVDKFDGHKTITTTLEVVAKTMGIKTLQCYGMYLSDSAMHLNTLCFYYTAGTVFSLDKKNECTLILKSGEKFKSPYSGSRKVYVSSDLAAFYIDLDKDDMQKLIKDPVMSIRFESSSANRDFEIKDKYQQVIPDILTLLLSKQN